MPLPFLYEVYVVGWPDYLPDPWWLAKIAGSIGALAAAKYYFSGTTNTSERAMNGRVAMITGGTSGIGAHVALDLARRGAHVVLLTAQPPSDPFVIDYVEELRKQTDNQMIYAEQMDLSSLHSVRTFATKWIDSLPPRRLDMVILCAAVDAAVETETPASKKKRRGGKRVGVTTPEGIERSWMINYLANFHFLALLSPALRSQPFDRDVRVIVATCSSYIGAPPLVGTTADASSGAVQKVPDWSPKLAYSRSKLALMVFARAFQKHLDAYKRPDGLPGNVRVLLVDPGLSRTPGLRRWISGGSILGLLLIYVLFYPFWWLIFKSADQGAQSILFAAMDGSLRRMQDLAGRAGEKMEAAMDEDDPLNHKLIKECRLVDVARHDVRDQAVAKALWEESDRLVESTEKHAAQMRKLAEKAKQEAEQAQKDADKASEIDALLETIKKGKAAEKDKAKAKEQKGGKTASRKKKA